MGCACGTRVTYTFPCEGVPAVFCRNLGKGPPSNSDTVPDQNRLATSGASSSRFLNISLPEVRAKPSQGLVESGLNRELVLLLHRGT